ncbi:MAG: 3-methyl-2-oxobutanoate hydroxymethyltransferase [Cyanobacteria bacterium SIG31]|nr:3-methyl-2-oxobutanoate hydroxymethyltransferase [Cyanobacteria bacterium SIG31]
MNRVKNINDFQKLKDNNEKIAMLTAYDYSTAKALDEAEIDGILVGDSLAMVALGYDNTYNITIDEMIIFIQAVSRGAKNSFIIGDMPFMSYNLSLEQGLENASRMISAGANAVKLEGCNEHILTLVKRCAESGIPVLAHLGLTPQLLNTLGGYKIQGKTAEQAEYILECAKKLEQAGAFAVVLELLPAESAEYITRNLKIPTIGIGAGVNCDGQIVVTDDILGKFTDFAPKFVKKFANLHDVVLDGVRKYTQEVKNLEFPSKKESFELTENEKEKLCVKGVCND